MKTANKITENGEFYPVSMNLFDKEISCEVRRAQSDRFVTRFGREVCIVSDNSGVNHTVFVPQWEKNNREPYIFNVRSKESLTTNEVNRLVDKMLTDREYPENGSEEIGEVITVNFEGASDE